MDLGLQFFVDLGKSFWNMLQLKAYNFTKICPWYYGLIAVDSYKLYPLLFPTDFELLKMNRG